jgi:hypothetical protein
MLSCRAVVRRALFDFVTGYVRATWQVSERARRHVTDLTEAVRQGHEVGVFGTPRHATSRRSTPRHTASLLRGCGAPAEAGARFRAWKHLACVQWPSAGCVPRRQPLRQPLRVRSPHLCPALCRRPARSVTASVSGLVQAACVFVIARADCDAFAPAAAVDPEYARLVRQVSDG